MLNPCWQLPCCSNFASKLKTALSPQLLFLKTALLSQLLLLFLSLSCLLRSSELLPAFSKNPFILNSLTNNYYRECTEHNCSISSLCIDPFIACQVICVVFWECCSASKEFKPNKTSSVIVEKVKVLDIEIFHCQVCSFSWFDTIRNLETFPVDSLFCPKLSVLAPWDHPSNDSRAERN